MKINNFKLKFFVLPLLLVILYAGNAMASNAMDQPFSPTPQGFDGYAVYIADGEYDIASPNPDVPGCAFGMCEADFFWNEVLGATDEERAAKKEAAKAFFFERFGLDIDSLVASGEIAFLDIYGDPRANYRARTVAGEKVHELGWEVHDQVFLVIAQADITLGGQFAGEVAPTGTFMVFGQYVIDKSRLVRQGNNADVVPTGEQIRIEFQSTSPIPPPGVGRVLAFSCEVTNSPWGRGIAQGVSAPKILGDGMAPGSLQKQNIRNVLTFDGVDGLGDFAGVYNR